MHYRPDMGRLQSRYENYRNSLSREQFVNLASLENTTIDYWNVSDVKKPENTVKKFLGGPGRGQTQRGNHYIEILKRVMEEHTKKMLGKYYDDYRGGGREEEAKKLRSVESELQKIRDEKYEKEETYSRYDSALDSIISLLDDYFTDEDVESFGLDVENLKSTRDKLNKSMDDMAAEITKLTRDLEEKNNEYRSLRDKMDKKLVFYDL
jgi:hypothetical protein